MVAFIEGFHCISEVPDTLQQHSQLTIHSSIKPVLGIALKKTAFGGNYVPAIELKVKLELPTISGCMLLQAAQSLCA